MTNFERLLDARKAFDHPVTIGVVSAIVAGLLIASVLIRVLGKANKISDETYRELIARVRSWYVLAAAMVVPILLGAAWVFGFFLLLSLFCFREYARATGLNASRTATFSVVLAILLTYLAVVDNWLDFFTTSWVMGICLIALIGLTADAPGGFIKRIALSMVAFALFGISLGHLAFMANDSLFRPMLLWILFCTELNDVFAYLSGKTFGKRKLLPNTSPNKTWGGAIGAVVLTSLLAAVIGHFVFAGTTVDHLPHLLMLGLLISVLGQCGDLLISSIKRDLGIKDMAETIPGHGGLLDRFDSLLLVAPIVFHYVNYFKSDGIGGDQVSRILTGSW